MKTGYKLTEVGVIPEDWNSVQIGSILDEISMGPFGSDITVSNFVSSGVPVLNGANVSCEKLTEVFENFVTSEKARDLKKAVARRGEVVVTHRGTIGQISYIPEDSKFERYVVSQSQFRARFSRRILPEWVVRYFYSEGGQRALLEGKGHTGVPAIAQPTTTFRKLFIPLPPNMDEQRAIATALSDVDALLAGLDKLIAKKRDIKQATMQQLLTGKTRLPGFTGAWEVKRLGDLAEITMGRTPSRSISDYWGAGHVWLSIADMKGKVILESKEEITGLAASGMTMVPAGTLMMSFKLSIGRLAFAGRPLYTNEAICAFRQPKCNVEYLYYALKRVDFSLYGKQAVKGYTLNADSLRCVEVSIPNEQEQAGIASVLSGMDAELDQLEAWREKTRLLKQGMMQELLTGRTRLV